MDFSQSHHRNCFIGFRKHVLIFERVFILQRKNKYFK